MYSNISNLDIKGKPYKYSFIIARTHTHNKSLYKHGGKTDTDTAEGW